VFSRQVSIALFKGQWCTLMPFQKPITVVLGRPLQVSGSQRWLGLGLMVACEGSQRFIVQVPLLLP
jgi:hypothetical protein